MHFWIFFFLFIFSNLGQQRFFIRGKREKRESGKKRLDLHDLDSDVAVAILFAKKKLTGAKKMEKKYKVTQTLIQKKQQKTFLTDIFSGDIWAKCFNTF